MSTRDFFSEHLTRVKVSALALVLGACVGAGAGVHSTFPVGRRTPAAEYMLGTAMQHIGVCAFRAFGKVPYPCRVSVRINAVAAAPAAQPEQRELAHAFVQGKNRVLRWWLPLTAFGFAALAWLGLAWRNRRAWRLSRRSTDEHIRGAEAVGDKVLNRMARRERGKGDLRVGSVTLPREVETEHILVAGGTGKGKTVAITGLLDTIRGRGDRVIIADYGGSYLARYGLRSDSGDRVLNPLDARSLPWSPLSEVTVPADTDMVARALVPDIEGKDAQWNRYAQTFVSALLLRGYTADWTNRDLLRHALEADMGTLRKVVVGTPAAGLVSEGNERMFGSVRGTVTAYVGGLRYCDSAAGKDAPSLREWATTGQGCAFFSYRQDQLAVIGHLAGAMLDLIMTGMLSQTPDLHRRTWFVLDEVSALGKVNGLEGFLTKSRQFGGCVILGLQSIAQLRATYGSATAETMLGNLSTQLTFGGSDPDTVQYLSRALGEEEVLRRTPGASNADQGASASWSEAVQVVASVMASEIARLPKLHCFLSISGGLPIARVRVTLPQKGKDKAERFVPRDFSWMWKQPKSMGGGTKHDDTLDLPEFGSGKDLGAT